MKLRLGLLRVAWRYLRRKALQSSLMMLGIALGVGVVVAVDLANTSARRAFDYSNAAIVGRATHQIVAGSGGLGDMLYADLHRDGVLGGEIAAAPVVSEYVTSQDLGGRPFTLLGVDPLAEAPFRGYLDPASLRNPQAWRQLLTQSDGIIISSDVAGRYGLEVGSEISLQTGGYARPARVIGVIEPADGWSREALGSLMIMDIAAAQELTGTVGRIDRIDLILQKESGDLVTAVRESLPPTADLVPVASRTQAVQDLTAAFRLNLFALSLLALVVGMFLIYNTMTFSVIQRRETFAILRSLGATRREVMTLVLTEAALVGAIGGGAGVLLGILLGQGTVRLITQTINDLYFVLAVDQLDLSLSTMAKGMALGFLGTVVVAVPPAWEAVASTPRLALSRSGLERKATRAAGMAAPAGIILGVVSLVVLLIASRALWLSFSGTLGAVLGFALLTPWATRILMRASSPIMTRLVGPIGRMAPRAVLNSLSRTGVAVAALMIAVSVSIGVSLMVGSFRHTVQEWLSQVLTGDIYISAPGVSAVDASGPINPTAVDLVSSLGWVERVDALRTTSVRGETGQVELLAVDDPEFGSRPFIWTGTSRDRIWERMQAGAVAVSEPFANRHDLGWAGDGLTLQTLDGPVSFPIVGIYTDYGSSAGNVSMALQVYQEHWADETITGLALQLSPGEDVGARAAQLGEQLSSIQGLLVQPNARLREEALQVFDRTFAITAALRVLSLVVAFIGILSAMLSLQLEKGREYGVLKALGLTGRQLWALVSLETGLMGAVAGLLSMPTGLALAAILVHIINRRFFGWTLWMRIEIGPFLWAIMIAIGAAILAGLYPSLRLRRLSPAEALRYE